MFQGFRASVFLGLWLQGFRDVGFYCVRDLGFEGFGGFRALGF